jgi:hypothetical protein
MKKTDKQPMPFGKTLEEAKFLVENSNLKELGADLRKRRSANWAVTIEERIETFNKLAIAIAEIGTMTGATIKFVEAAIWMHRIAFASIMWQIHYNHTGCTDRVRISEEEDSKVMETIFQLLNLITED